MNKLAGYFVGAVAIAGVSAGAVAVANQGISNLTDWKNAQCDETSCPTISDMSNVGNSPTSITAEGRAQLDFVMHNSGVTFRMK